MLLVSRQFSDQMYFFDTRRTRKVKAGFLIMHFKPTIRAVCVALLLCSLCGLSCQMKSAELRSQVQRALTKYEPTFKLYSRLSSKDGYEDSLSKPDYNQLLQNVDPSCPTYILIPSAKIGEQQWIERTKNIILKAQDANVLVIDYTQALEYVNSAKFADDIWMVVHIGDFISEITNNLRYRKQALLSMQRITFVAFGFGVKIANRAMAKRKRGKEYNLIALDPMKKFPKIGFDKIKADHSIVIRTDIDNLGGEMFPGDIEVYLNGGLNQPGCEGTPLAEGCNHEFATEFFVKSIGSIRNSDIDESTASKQVLNDSGADQCFPMGYWCDSYKSFLAGRCGYCNFNEYSNDKSNVNCAYIGLDKFNLKRTSNENQIRELVKSTRLGHAINVEELKPKRFFALSDSDANCVFMYRIVVGTTDYSEKGMALSVAIPLWGDSDTWTTVELEKEASVLEPLQSFYRTLNQRKTYMLNLSDDLESLQFHTALLTLKQTNGDSSSQSSHLSRPFERPSFVRILGAQLDSIQFVHIQYLSHPDVNVRERNSFLFDSKNEVSSEEDDNSLVLT